MHSRSSDENLAQFQTKLGKVYTRFSTKTVQKPIPFGAAHIYMALIHMAVYKKRARGYDKI